MTLQHIVRQHEPLLLVSHTATVEDVIQRMDEEHFGAAMILDGDRLSGIFTKRDVLSRIVRADVSPATTQVAEVMTRDVVTINEMESIDAAIHCIQAYQVSHLPIVNDQHHVVGVLTIKRLLHDKIKDLLEGLRNFESYFNDAPGG